VLPVRFRLRCVPCDTDPLAFLVTLCSRSVTPRTTSNHRADVVLISIVCTFPPIRRLLSRLRSPCLLDAAAIAVRCPKNTSDSIGSVVVPCAGAYCVRVPVLQGRDRVAAHSDGAERDGLRFLVNGTLPEKVLIRVVSVATLFAVSLASASSPECLAMRLVRFRVSVARLLRSYSARPRIPDWHACPSTRVLTIAVVCCFPILQRASHLHSHCGSAGSRLPQLHDL
jgi:hypothetical protein